jgi:CubicO group peptidase (beta-lactamase class C family)
MLRQHLRLILIITLCTAFFAAKAQARNTFEQRIESVLKQNGFNGTILVADKGTILHHRGYGAAVMEWNIANVRDTRFRIASLSKTFTSTLILMLAEDGKISLDAPLNAYLSDYPAPYANEVTIRHLLTHRSGIPRQFNIPDWTKGKSITSIPKAEFLSMIAEMSLAFEPGTKRLYSSANYYILGVVIEAVTKQAFGDVLQTKILRPLQMNEADIYRAGEIIPTLARAYKPVHGKYSFCPKVSGKYCTGGAINFALFHASGSMHATARDLLKWDQALYGNTLLGDKSKEILFDMETGTSWDVAKIAVTDKETTMVMIAHGELEGYASLMVRFPDERRTIIMLNNTGMPYGHLIETAHRIAVLLYEE